MLRTFILGTVFLGLSACAHTPTAGPAAATTAAKTDAQDSDEAAAAAAQKKSIFESQTKEDVEKLNQVDKSLYEVSGEVHPEQ